MWGTTLFVFIFVNYLHSSIFPDNAFTTCCLISYCDWVVPVTAANTQFTPAYFFLISLTFFFFFFERILMIVTPMLAALGWKSTTFFHDTVRVFFRRGVKWLRISSKSNSRRRKTQIKCGQATHLDYMCTCAVRKPLTSSIALARGCAKSITQADPWCWTSWKSCLVSWLHLPAHLSSCCLAAR